ncbi:MAG TPA: 3-phosphoglycerate dehydrogenase [Clostridiales bacterium]|nr:3-phosphoglycerate dehydrogenase [Clostridiales bacterium]
MYNISTFNKISPVGLNLFEKNKYTLSEENLNDVQGIVLRSYKLHDVELPDSLKAIARAGAGVNNIPIQKCTEKGVVVFNTPGANANGVMELTLLGLLMSSRKVTEGIEWVNSLEGDVSKEVEKGKSQFKGPEIKGKKLGVIGLGAIGVLVANTGIKLGMDVIGYDPYISVEKAIGLSWDVEYAKSLNYLLKNCDYITLHIPLMDKTKNFLNKKELQLMKSTARLINMSRGGLVNEDALLKVLKENKLAKYVTDFPNEKLLRNKNVICLPHLGASTYESEENCAVMAVKQLKEYLEEGKITNSVNYPECQLERTEGTERITVFNKNVPHMISSLSSVLANNDINIIEMVNKSKGNFAYNVIDIEGDISKDILEKIKSIDGIIKVRHII